jgi:two-component system chemotaxis response regulator CheY
MESLSVLIIDDQPFFRVLLTEVLRSFGVTKLHAADDGESGFAAFCNVRPDIVVTDWLMPKLNGTDLTRKIRALSDEQLRTVPVILVTSNNQRAQIELARSCGIDEFILKPISAKAVADRLREVIERPRPLINFVNYTGPCRRRRSNPDFSGPFRRFDDPIEVDGDNAELLNEGYRSILQASSLRVSELVKGLSKSNANIRPIHIAISEMQSIAEDMAQPHLERVFEILLEYLVIMNRNGKSSPGLIEAHMKAVALLLRTPDSQKHACDEIVAGLERMLKRPKAA